MLICYCLRRPNKVCPCRGYRGFPPSISFHNSSSSSSSKHFICRYEALSVLSPHHSLFVQAIAHEINLTAWNPPPPPRRLASQHLDLQYFVEAEVVHTLSCGENKANICQIPHKRLLNLHLLKRSAMLQHVWLTTPPLSTCGFLPRLIRSE